MEALLKHGAKTGSENKQGLSAMGATLVAGHIITTGTCVVPMDIGPLDTVLMDFGVLGQVRCGFSGE